MTSYKRGMVVLVLFPNSDLATVRYIEIDRIIGTLSSMGGIEKALKITFGLK